jgi:hypothetical protein
MRRAAVVVSRSYLFVESVEAAHMLRLAVEDTNSAPRSASGRRVEALDARAQVHVIGYSAAEVFSFPRRLRFESCSSSVTPSGSLT